MTDTKPAEAKPAEDDVDIALEPSDEVLSILDYIDTDVAAEEEGKWFTNVWPGVDLKLRRLTSKASIRCRQKLDEQNQRHMKNGEWPEAVAIKIFNAQLAESVIVDWRGPAFKDREGKPIPFDKRTARLWLETKPNFRYKVIQLANEQSNWRIEQQQELEKN